MLSVMANPFSQATDCPKIPDGKYSESFGERVNAITQIAFNGSDDPIEKVDYTKGVNFLLTPTIRSPFVIYKGSPLVAYSIAKDNVLDVYAAPASTWSWLNPLITNKDIKSMRVVSCGYRIQLMNNADDNEGYFTSGRRSIQSGAPNFTSPETLQGFVCGKLRDIHKYQFNCLPLGREYQNMYFDVNSTAIGAENTDAEPAMRTDDLVVSELEQPFQNGFDQICLSVFGGEKTKLMIYTSFNVEFTVKETSELFRFQTSCTAMPNLVDSHLPRIKRDIRAAIPLTGSFPLA